MPRIDRQRLKQALIASRAVAYKEAEFDVNKALGTIDSWSPWFRTKQLPGGPLSADLPPVDGGKNWFGGARIAPAARDAQGVAQSTAGPTQLTLQESAMIKGEDQNNPYAHYTSLGFSPAQDGKTYTLLDKPVRYSPESAGILDAANGLNPFNAGGRVKAHMTERIKNMSLWDKFRGANPYFTALRRDAFALYKQAQAYKAVGNEKEANRLMAQYNVLRQAITKGEPVADAAFKPYRNMANIGAGVLGLVFLLRRLFGGTQGQPAGYARPQSGYNGYQ